MDHVFVYAEEPRQDPCEGCDHLNKSEKYRVFACDSPDASCPPGFPHGGA